MKKNSVTVNTLVYLLVPVIILLFPDTWIVAWIVAAAIHESFHIIALRLFKVRILKIEIGLFGTQIETETMDPHKELIVALAGPLGILIILIFARCVPRVALCGIAQTAYNMIPVYPLDGGRAIRCLLSLRFKDHQLIYTESLILITIIICCILASIIFKLGMLPVILAIGLLIKYRNANLPCKE